MTLDINKLNARLTSYCNDEYIVANETIFNLGVKLGRFLEANKLQDKRLDYFCELDKSKNLAAEIAEIKEQVDGIMSSVVTNAIKEEVTEYGGWEVGQGGYYASHITLNDAIAKKYSIQTQRVEQPERNGDFLVTFDFFGDVREFFVDCHVEPIVTVRINNNTGEDSEILINSAAVDRAVYGVGINLRGRTDNAALNDILRLRDLLSKKYLFQLITGQTL